MGRTRGSSSSSSIDDSTNHFGFSTTAASSSSSSSYHRDFNTDLSLGLTINSVSPPYYGREQESEWEPMKAVAEDQEYECNSSTFFVKVYMEGIPIGRKLDLMAHQSYYHLITTVERMFNTRIIWAEAEMEEGDYYQNYHVLTYEDKEGDWMMLGDVPWEMFLSAVRRLKIGKC